MMIYTVIYRHGSGVVAMTQEAPSALDAAHAVSIATGGKCAIIAVLPGIIEPCVVEGLPDVCVLWKIIGHANNKWNPATHSAERGVPRPPLKSILR